MQSRVGSLRQLPAPAAQAARSGCLGAHPAILFCSLHRMHFTSMACAFSRLPWRALRKRSRVASTSPLITRLAGSTLPAGLASSFSSCLNWRSRGLLSTMAGGAMGRVGGAVGWSRYLTTSFAARRPGGSPQPSTRQAETRHAPRHRTCERARRGSPPEKSLRTDHTVIASSGPLRTSARLEDSYCSFQLKAESRRSFPGKRVRELASYRLSDLGR